MAYDVHKIFGLHLVHSHANAQADAVILGTNFTNPQGCWARPTRIRDVDCNNVHGHIFLLHHSFRILAYEYRVGPMVDISRIDPRFFHSLTEYLHENGLSTVLGLQVLPDWPPPELIEMELREHGTVMLDKSDANHGDPFRVTGWLVHEDDGIVSFKGNETHSPTTKGGHQPFKDGKSLSSIAELKTSLKEVGVL